MSSSLCSPLASPAVGHGGRVLLEPRQCLVRAGILPAQALVASALFLKSFLLLTMSHRNVTQDPANEGEKDKGHLHKVTT